LEHGSQESASGIETKQTSLPKQKLIEFLKNSVAEKEYLLILPVPVEGAEAFIHRMRVELSRFREKVRDRGRVPKSFKMLYIKIKTEAIIDINTGSPNTKCKVFLMKSTSGYAVDAEIDAIFEQVAGGRVLEFGGNK